MWWEVERGREWLVTDRFGGEWRLRCVAADAAEDEPERRDPFEGIGLLEHLLHNGFDPSGPRDPALAGCLISVYDRLTNARVGETLRERMYGARELYGFERHLRGALVRCAQNGWLTIEHVEPVACFIPTEETPSLPAPVPPAREEVTFIGIRLVDQDGRALRARRVRIEASSADAVRVTDAAGRLRLDDLASGPCKVTLLDVDHRDVQSPAAKASATEITPAAKHTVVQGETTASIAAAAGFLWFDTVWSAKENADLRKARPDPQVLFAGDCLFVPERRAPELSLPTGAEHTIVLRVSKLQIRVKLLDWFGEPRAAETITIDVDGAAQTADTDADGVVAFEVPASARDATLRGASGDDVPLAIGHLDPASTASGAAARLRNLGWYPSPDDPIAADRERLRFALELFVDASGASTEGSAFDGFLDQLRSEHGL